MPQSNVFLIINLGCEMLYVIDQRLKAQNITVEKSVQVLRDLTYVLFDQKFIDQLVSSHPNQSVLTIQQCRILLTDIACCSLMRLDTTSMDKLWDLMVMLFKWQIFHANDDPQKLLDISFRHMDGVSKLLPEMRKTLLVDATKRRLIEHWDMHTEIVRCDIMNGIKQWLQVFNVKISILIRLGFQRTDGSFETDMGHLDDELYHSYLDHIGENVYARNNSMRSLEFTGKSDTTANTANAHGLDTAHASSPMLSHELMSLVNQLSIRTEYCDGSCAQRNGAGKGNVSILDDVTCSMNDEVDSEDNVRATTDDAEFVHVANAHSTLQKYLEQFRLENTGDLADENPVPKEESTPFDATEELLRMLDND